MHLVSATVRSWLRRSVAKWAIRVALTRPPPEGWFTLTGEAAMRNNSYGAYLEHETEPNFTVKEITSGGVTGFLQVGDRRGADASIPFRCLDQYSLAMRHVYKDSYYVVLPTSAFLVRHYLHYAFFHHLFFSICQYFYNKKGLARKDRVSVLQIVLENTIKDRAYETSALAIMNAMYGIRWTLHPKADDLSSYYHFVMDSLVLSGDLVLGKNTISYRLAPQALVTLHKEEQDATRHGDNRKTQNRIVALTWVLALAAVAQAGVSVWPMISPIVIAAEDTSTHPVYPLGPPVGAP